MTLFLPISVSICIVDGTLLIAKNRDGTSIQNSSIKLMKVPHSHPRQPNKKLTCGHVILKIKKKYIKKTKNLKNI
jgi:hypothetical protein